MRVSLGAILFLALWEFLMGFMAGIAAGHHFH